jgi:hypothetical protein
MQLTTVTAATPDLPATGKQFVFAETTGQGDPPDLACWTQVFCRLALRY